MPILPKKFPAPIAKPMAPFMVAALIMTYGIGKLQTVMSNSEEFRNDPRNPNRQASKPAEKH